MVIVDDKELAKNKEEDSESGFARGLMWSSALVLVLLGCLWLVGALPHVK